VKRGAIIGTAIAAALVLVGALAWWLLSRPAGPEQTAMAYLEALAAGDGEKAMSLTHAPPTDFDPAAALDGAEKHLTSPRVESVEARGDSAATASVSFSLDGAKHSASLGLSKKDGRWAVADGGFGSLTATATIGDAVLIGGESAPAGDEVVLLPAVYNVEAAPATLLDGSTTVAILPREHSEAKVEASVSPQATTLAQGELDAYAQTCAQAADAVPDHCGIRVPWAADLATLDTIVFRIEQTPQLALSPDLRTFDATGGIIVATATGTTREGSSASFTYRADDWALRGTIALSPDGMQLAVG
jgi:hypothetical protein